MITIFFVITKLTDTLLLSWWWVILVIFLDAAVRYWVTDAIQQSYLNGIEEGREDKEKELRGEN